MSGFANLMTFKVNGSQFFYSSGTFTVPLGVRKLTVYIQAAGGGSSFWETHGSNRYSGGSGGSGGFCKIVVNVHNGEQYWVEVGSGGYGAGTDDNAGAGGNSSFGSFATCGGGGGGIANDNGANGGYAGSAPALSSIVVQSVSGTAGNNGGRWVEAAGAASYISAGYLSDKITGDYGKGANTTCGADRGGYYGKNGIVMIEW
jgi:hypothetical protein